MNPSLSVLRVLVLAVPLAASALHSLRPAVSSRLEITADRPALVFESYLADQSNFVAESRPVISEDFHFRNQGSEPVRITGVEPSCGCLRPQLSAMQIAPGDTGRITLPIRTVNEPAGLREYLVNIHYEDPRPRTVTVTWRVRLPEKKLLIEPRVLMVLGNFATDDVFPIRISDFRPGKTAIPLRISQIETAPPQIQAQLAGQTAGEASSETTLDVRFSEDLTPGKHRGLITLRTEDPDYPALQIPVFVGREEPGLEGRLKASPEVGRVVVRRHAPEESAGTDITVTLPADWTVSRCESWPAQLQATAGPLTPAADDLQTTTVVVSIPELPPAGIQQGLIAVHFDTPAGPRMLTVPMSVIWL